MSYVREEIRPGAYYDSVVLMELQRALAELPGVLDAGVVMATPANCALLAASDLKPSRPAAPEDLLIVVRADSEAAADEALGQVDALLAARRRPAGSAFRPRSLAAALKQLPEAEVVLISVPGRYAPAVAREALAHGRHVFLYSDNVSVADELALKQAAQEKGLLLMGPDCGSAILGGIGLGFANRVRPGQVGLVAASGTGLQAVASYLHRLGAGVSQAIGAGGRDLGAEIGGLTTHQGLALLASDRGTRVIVLISKPPAASVAASVLQATAATAKPVVVAFSGYAPPARRIGNLSFAAGLRDAAELAAELARASAPQAPPAGDQGKERGGFLRGLYSGGTLAAEALQAFSPFLGGISNNLKPAGGRGVDGHVIIDLGADEYTQGRLHPMLDNASRLRQVRQAADNPAVACLLLDVVLGYGAHPDPAAELAPAIEGALAQAQAAGRQLAAVVLMVGTDEDPQDLPVQEQRFRAAGATVRFDTAAAVEACLASLLPASARPGAWAGLKQPLAAVNVGLESFYESLMQQGGRAVHVEWRPPAGGDEQMMGLLARLKTGQPGGGGSR
ncbi:MAG: acyl-CoA synthetase FdrA [Candidatus Promineifilaceae bacterium]